MANNHKMKRMIFLVCVFFTIVFGSWGQSFEMPRVTNTIESVKEAFRVAIKLFEDMGVPDYKSAWNYSQNLLVKDHIEHLDSVLTNMTYDSVKSYVSTIRSNLDNIDFQDYSKRQQEEFEQFLQKAHPNYSFELSDFFEYYNENPFPASLELNYDKSQITAYDESTKQYEQQLAEYKNQLAALLPRLDGARANLQDVSSELNKPGRRDWKRTQQLRQGENNILTQLSYLYIEREELTNYIKKLEGNLKNSETGRNRLISDLEKSARENYIRSLWADFNNFYKWEMFFEDENAVIHDFLIIKNIKQRLYHLLDVIPQRQADAYQPRVDAFCAEWGI
jgi:hypothetical protein